MSTTATTTVADLSGLTALVTGATSGIGEAVALKLAEHGATVLVHGRDPKRGAGVVDIPFELVAAARLFRGKRGGGCKQGQGNEEGFTHQSTAIMTSEAFTTTVT